MSKRITQIITLLNNGRRIPSCDNPLSRVLLGDPFMPDRKNVKKIPTNSPERKITTRNSGSKEIF